MTILGDQIISSWIFDMQSYGVHKNYHNLTVFNTDPSLIHHGMKLWKIVCDENFKSWFTSQSIICCGIGAHMNGLFVQHSNILICKVSKHHYNI
jgi:hypothetical protein